MHHPTALLTASNDPLGSHVLDLAILGLLTDADLHGYELKKQLPELLGGRAAISFGSLYPALARLEKQGAVKAVEQRTEVPATPMSGSLTGELAALRARLRTPGRPRDGRGKKVYGITDHGRARLHELLTDPDVSDDRAFPVRVALCHHLPPAGRLELFEARRAELQHRRDELGRRRATRGGRSRSTVRPVDTYRAALAERDATALDHDLAWLERLIEAEHHDVPQEDLA